MDEFRYHKSDFSSDDACCTTFQKVIRTLNQALLRVGIPITFSETHIEAQNIYASLEDGIIHTTYDFRGTLDIRNVAENDAYSDMANLELPELGIDGN